VLVGRILRAIKKRLPLGSLERRDYEREADGRTIENDDGWAQMYSGAEFPPDYVKDDDDRPPR